MLHSFHYYACYCALICFLHHQQQAASLTIIIDGATTNEWATRDEYQRLVNGQTGAASASVGRSEEEQQQQGGDVAAGELGFDGSVALDGGGAAAAALPRQLNSESLAPISTTGNNNGDLQQTSSSSLSLSSPFEAQTAEDLETALERLDLIGEQRKQLQSRQRQLKQLELQQRLNIQQQVGAKLDLGSGQQFKSGARTINDLVPIGDQDLDEPMRRLKERNSSAQRYCGKLLIDVLEVVCKGRYWNGESEPQIVNPIIKSKRFVDSDDSFAGFDSRQLHQQLVADQREQQLEQQPVSRRRKLRTLDETLDAPVNHNDGVNVNTLKSINNRYLSSHLKSFENNIDHQRQNPTNDNNTNNDHMNTKTDNTTNNSNQLTQQTSNLTNNRNNRHSKMALYRQIRGASGDCCKRPCYLEELKPYCQATI